MFTLKAVAFTSRSFPCLKQKFVVIDFVFPLIVTKLLYIDKHFIIRHVFQFCKHTATDNGTFWISLIHDKSNVMPIVVLKNFREELCHTFYRMVKVSNRQKSQQIEPSEKEIRVSVLKRSLLENSTPTPPAVMSGTFQNEANRPTGSTARLQIGPISTETFRK